MCSLTDVVGGLLPPSRKCDFLGLRDKRSDAEDSLLKLHGLLVSESEMRGCAQRHFLLSIRFSKRSRKMAEWWKSDAPGKAKLPENDPSRQLEEQLEKVVQSKEKLAPGHQVRQEEEYEDEGIKVGLSPHYHKGAKRCAITGILVGSGTPTLFIQNGWSDKVP